MPFGEPLIELDAVDSTNTAAARLMAEGRAGHGAVVLAHAQLAGQGQRGRTWHSAPGLDLAFSVVCQPQGLKAEAQFALGRIAALAVHDAVRVHVPGEVRIKWPNDILIDGRKAAGILIRNEISGDRVASSIVGIGLNVNSTDLPFGDAATSLHLAAGHPFDRMAVLRGLLERFEHWWHIWGQAQTEGLAPYSDRLWARGRWADMRLDGRPLQARPLDVDHQGRLLVELPEGAVAAFGLDRLRFAPRAEGLPG